MDEATLAHETLGRLQEAQGFMAGDYAANLALGRQLNKRALRYVHVVTTTAKILFSVLAFLLFLAIVTPSHDNQVATLIGGAAPSFSLLRLLSRKALPFLLSLGIPFALYRFGVGLPHASLFHLLWMPYYRLDRKMDELSAACACTYSEYVDACHARGTEPVVSLEHFTPETVGRLADVVRSGRAATVTGAWDVIARDAELDRFQS